MSVKEEIWRQAILPLNSTVKQVIKNLDQVQIKIVLIVDEASTLIGTVSDGDIRRGLLKGLGLESNISSIVNYNPLVATVEMSRHFVMQLMEVNKVQQIPIVGEQQKLLGLHRWDKITSPVPRTNLMVIMAGGKGTRMKPFTNILPKPLLPLKDKTVIEKIIENFLDYGFYNFKISINYKSKIIKSFFDELKPKYKVSFIEESKPMGTIGSINLLKNKLKSDFFVCNCDTLISENYDEILKFHKKSKNLITLVASSKHISIPYGVCEVDTNGDLIRIREKPKKNYLINVGIYIFKKEIFNYIKNYKKIDITELLDIMKRKNLKVGVFPSVKSVWYDVGQWENYNYTKGKIN